MTSFSWRLFLVALVPALALTEPLQADDECLDESCTLNALQLRGAAGAVPVLPDLDDIMKDPDDVDEDDDEDEDEDEEEDGDDEKPSSTTSSSSEAKEEEEDTETPEPGVPDWEPLPEDANCAKPDTQCGGQWYYGPKCCWHGHQCFQVNQYYSQCVTKEKAEELAHAATQTSTTTTTTNLDPQGCQLGYQQCGGFDEAARANWTGKACCQAGFICTQKSAFFSQCAPTVKDGPFIPYTPSKVLEEPSNAPLLTFYVYRAAAEDSDYLDNINVGNLQGTLWYVQNEVVYVRPRKFNISRIIRYKITTKAPQPLYDLGMNFGARFAYDEAQCDGPWNCELNYNRLGYFVGCNNLGMFPFPLYDTHYLGAKWFALPGPCSSKTFEDKDAKCDKGQPGGRCMGTPTGQGNCTYSIEEVGFLTLDEIAGIKNYHDFVHTGGVEFNKTLDKGEGTNFWNEMNNTERNTERVEKVRAMFEKKYPDQPTDEELEAPACDFNFTAFYGEAPPVITTTTAPPTTEAETTEPETTEAETTEEATTEAETTAEAATTEAETTEAATTEAATTEAATTEAATTEEATTEAATTEAATTEAETTEAATTEAETTEAATTEAETSEAATTEAETAEEATTEAETTEPPKTTTRKGCKDAVFGTHCYSAVTWAKEHGLKLHPTWYPGLTSSSSFSDFQERVHHVNPKDCPLPCTTNAGCHDSVAGESCYSAVKWAMKHGIDEHPTWYKGLTKESSFRDFQVAVHKSTPKKCPMPCEA